MNSSTSARVVTVNGGSSSIKFAVFSTGLAMTRVAAGAVTRIGAPGSMFVARDEDGREIERRPAAATDNAHAAEQIADWLEDLSDSNDIAGIGHRIVHGGVSLIEHQEATPKLLEELRRTQPLDLAHLPLEIALLDVFHRRFPSVRQVVCFDTAFHNAMPRVAKMLPIPRRYDKLGIRRLGFHGLSYTYLMEELLRIAGPDVANGRVILAHLGAGASMAAVRGSRPIDTSMGFTPTGGVVMGTRPGDLDPGVVTYLMRQENLTVEQMTAFLNERCGLLGISETSSDMRDLIEHRNADVRASEAVDLFCYHAAKCVGAFAAALNGLDTLVFAGGIGEHSPFVRAQMCAGLEFLGIKLEPARNDVSASVISANGSRVTVRVIPTDEEIVIVRTVRQLLGV